MGNILLPLLHNTITMMKFALALFALGLVFVCAMDMHEVIHDEVMALYHANNNITRDECKTECDAHFELLAHALEKDIDHYCNYMCTCIIRYHGNKHRCNV